jgi:hypothetical protein
MANKKFKAVEVLDELTEQNQKFIKKKARFE